MRSRMRLLDLRIALLAVATILRASIATADAPAPQGTPEQIEQFERSVRPLLSQSCGKCHGAVKQGGGLRLDSREAILEGGENGPAIIPGDPDGSLMVQAVRKTHADIKMPLKGTLHTHEIEALVDWIKVGAPWPPAGPAPSTVGAAVGGKDHWAFRPVQPVAIPTVNHANRLRTPVDAFWLARLDQEGLTPSPEADRRTLIRRLTFDLTGLPPTFAETREFLDDPRPDAYERLIDRLLASPHYGERWARAWLDVARYADTKGYVFQEERRYPYSYTYRDYVVRAFNSDLPYDRFLMEQLAADRLGPQADTRALAALGYVTLGRRFLNVQADIIDDRIDVVCRGLLGLTVACARCHDHKYDPIPADDYYSLYGVFASSIEPADPPEIPASVSDDLNRDFHAQLEAKTQARQTYLESKRSAIQADLNARAGAYLKAAFALGFDGRSAQLDAQAKAAELAPGRLRSFSMRWKQALDASKAKPSSVFGPWHAFAGLSADEFSRRAPGMAQALTSDVPQVTNPVVAGAFAAAAPSTMADVVICYANLLSQVSERWNAALKANPTVTALSEPAWEALREAFFGANGPLHVTSESLPRLLERDERNRLTELSQALDQLKATHPGSPPRAMVLNDAATPTNPHVFLRGNPGRPGKAVPRQFLAVLAGPNRRPFQEGSGRLELARAIASPENPLTARVFVNRVWAQHFGTGIVTTPSDFGRRGDLPSNQPLLDWLAADFSAHGWSVKHLHRRILQSSAYRQTSDLRTDLVTKDPENRLYGRFNRRRLDFEATRDAFLAATGALDRAQGGRGVPIGEPPFPPRRTLYGFIDRQNLDPVYRTFDFASPDASSPRRFVTTVPQQALFLMNSPFMQGQARLLALMPELIRGTPEQRIRAFYERLFVRAPEPRELAAGLAFLARQEHAGSSLPPRIWTYGHGDVKPSGRVTEFHAFPHWTGSAWQFGPKLPDPRGSFLHWSANGGHAGDTPAQSAMLRFTAPHDGAYAVESTLGHEGKLGDGVRGRVVSSRSGVLMTLTAHGSQQPVALPRVELKTGDTLDFMVDCRAEPSYDSFTWAPLLRELGEGGSHETWNAQTGFQGPLSGGMSPWEEYAQVLLLTNEFVFVD